MFLIRNNYWIRASCHQILEYIWLHTKKERIYYWSFKNYLSNLCFVDNFFKKKNEARTTFLSHFVWEKYATKNSLNSWTFSNLHHDKKNLFYGTWFQRLTCYPFFWSLISQTRKSSLVNWSRWWTKYMGKKLSLEPDSNQWPMDVYIIAYYSPPLYQLSYRGIHNSYRQIKKNILHITKQ